MLYDLPRRPSVALSVEMIEALSGLPRVVGLKDASANLARPVSIRAKSGPALIQLSGDDATFLAYLAQGGVGCISMTANVTPVCCAALLSAWRSGDRTEAARRRDTLDSLHATLFVESPIPVKEALAQQGHMNSAARLPLQRTARSTQEAISRALQIAPATKMAVPPSSGSFSNYRGLFVGLLVGVALIVGGLAFVPAFTLDPAAGNFATSAAALS